MIRGRRLELEKVRLTQRDLRCLCFVAEQGYATIDQLWKVAWGHQKNSDYTYDRVLHLERGGYLKKINVSSLSVKVVTATGLARASASSISLFPVPLNAGPVATAAHQLGLNELRIAMEGAGLQGWRSAESLIIDPKFKRIGTRHIPDAFYVSSRGVRTAIEYDRTLRKKERIKERLSLYLTELVSADRTIDRIIYLVPVAYLSLYQQIIEIGFSGIKDRFVLTTLDNFISQIKEGR